VTARKDKGGNQTPESIHQRQLKCTHPRWDAWYVPYWDPKHKYRTCLNCEKVEAKYIGW
jgi:hypothetical protein